MTTARARAVACLRTTFIGTLLAGTAPQALAAPDCAAGTAGDNVCIITLNNTATENLDAGAQVLGDKLQLGGAANFSFDVGRIGPQSSSGPRLTNFEFFEKIDVNTVTLTGTATTATNWSVLAGTLLVSGSTAAGTGNLLDSSSVSVAAGATFGLIGAGGANETIGTLSGTAGSFLTLGGTGTLTAGGADSTFAGVISGTGNFAKAGTAKLTLSADNSYTGTTTVRSGTLAIAHAGAIDNSSAVTIDVSGTLSGTVAYNINGNVTNNGFLEGNVTINGNVTNSLGIRPGQSPGTTTIIGNYTATGTTAHFDMEVDLDAAIAAPVNGTTHDFVNIQGNVAGTTFILLTPLNTPDAGLPTTGNGIQLVRVTGTTSPDAFKQFNAVNAGAYQYLLRYVANYAGTDDGYFLQSAVRDEMVAHPALLSAGQELIRNCHRDDQRVPDSPKGATYGRAWFGYRQGNSSFGPDTGIDMDLDYNCMTGGMDWRMGNGWFGGIIGGFGTADGDLVAPAGNAALEGDSRVFEVYAAFTQSAFFLNLSAGYADIDWIYRGALGAAQTSSSGFIAGAQAGTAVDLEFMAVKLIGALNYDDTNCGESCFSFAVVEDTGLLEAKATVRVDGNTSGGSFKPWAAVSYSDVISDGVNTVSLGGVAVSSDTNAERLSLDAGLQAYLDENFALFADGGYHESLGKDISGYKGSVGLKLYW